MVPERLLSWPPWRAHVSGLPGGAAGPRPRLSRRFADRYDDGAAGRLIGVLYAVSGTITMLSPLLPTNAAFNAPAVVAVGVVAFLSGMLFLALPWRRWPRATTLITVPAALVLIPLHNLAAGVDAYRFSLFYLVLYVWLGMSHPRGTALLFSPLVALSYVSPLVVQGAQAWAVASAAYAIPLFVTVGETLAWRSARLAESERRLQTLAYRDALTGLPNRSAMADRLAEVVSAPPQGDPHWLVFLDLDGFKSINDEQGHAAGDALLRLVADALVACCADTGEVARWAGDEFVMLLPPCPPQAAERTAHDAAARIGSLTELFAGEVSASFGTAPVTGDCSADDVLARADAAMYTAKALRRCTAVER